MIESNQFQALLLKSLVEGCFSHQTRNTDWMRFGGRLKSYFKDFASTAFARFRMTRTDHSRAALNFVLEHLSSFERAYYLLADDFSRALLVKLVTFKILGSKHVKLPLNTPQYWKTYHSIDRDYCRKKQTAVAWNRHWSLNRYEIPSPNGTISLDAHPLTVLATYFLQQYAYQKSKTPVSVRPGDVVIDGGGCWGDTALYFADQAGENGKVVSFEFLGENTAIFASNLRLNPKLGSRIQLVEEALWNASDQTLSFDDNGPGTKVGTVGAKAVRTVAIDDFVVKQKLPRIDFIKLDIEGAELQALQGASQTLKTFRPRLAVALYHKPDDILMIPAWLDGLGLGYRFYLDHFTIHAEETVLFATAA